MTPKRLRLLIGAAVVAVVAVVVIVGGGASDQRGASAQSNASDEPALGQLEAEVVGADAGLAETGGGGVASPSLVGGSAPVVAARPVVEGGFPETEEGVLGAAVALLEATEDVVSMSAVDAAQTQRLVSTRASAERLAGEVYEQMVDLWAQAPQGIQVWIAPIGARTVATERGYEVSIWYAEVVAIGTDAAVDSWTTVTYSMEWEGGGWKMDGSVSVPGPVPARSAAQVPTSASALVGVLSGYSDDGLVP